MKRLVLVLFLVLTACGSLPQNEQARNIIIGSRACNSYATTLRTVSAFRLTAEQWETLQGIVDVVSPICEGQAPTDLTIEELQRTLDAQLERLILLKNEAQP